VSEWSCFWDLATADRLSSTWQRHVVTQPRGALRAVRWLHNYVSSSASVLFKSTPQYFSTSEVRSDMAYRTTLSPSRISGVERLDDQPLLTVRNYNIQCSYGLQWNNVQTNIHKNRLTGSNVERGGGTQACSSPVGSMAASIQPNYHHAELRGSETVTLREPVTV
jgi:hypothetical protein